MNGEDSEGHWVIFDNPLASVREQLTIAFKQYLANITVQQCYVIVT